MNYVRILTHLKMAFKSVKCHLRLWSQHLNEKIQSVSKKKWDLFYDQYLHQITHKSAGKIFYLKGGIHSSVWSTKKILYDIREPRYNQIKMGYQIVKEILYWTIKSLEISCLISFCLFFGSIMLYKNGFQHETCLRMSP